MTLATRRARSLAACVLTACAALSCKSSPTGESDPLPASVSITPADTLLASLDDTLALAAQVRDAASAPIAAPVTWLSNAPAVATVDAAGIVVAVGNGVAEITATAGSVSGSATVTVEQAVDSAEVSGGGQGKEVGAPLDSAVTVTLLDARANPIAGAPFTFAVAADAGSVTPTAGTTDASGTATASWTLGTASGLQELDFEGGLSLEATLVIGATAYALDATSLVLHSGDAQTELVSLDVPEPLRVRALDVYGNGVPDVPVWFEVAGGAGASLGASEVLTDLDGVASVGLTLGDTLGTYTVEAFVPDSLTIDNTPLTGSPVVLTATTLPYALELVDDEAFASPPTVTVSDTVTLTGTGFHPTVEENTVLIGGQAAAVLEGTQSELVVQVPDFGCTPQRALTLELSRPEAALSGPVSVAPVGVLELQVGERAVLADPEAFCLQIPAGSNDEYVVGLTSTSWFDGASAFELTALDSLGPFPAPVASGAGPAASPPSVIASSEALDPETSLRAQEEALFSRLGGTSTLQPVGGAAAAPPMEGDTLELRLPDLRGDACTEYLPLSADVIHVGSRFAWASTEPIDIESSSALQDTLRNPPPAAVATLDLNGFDMLSTILGEPEPWIDGESRIVVVLTPEVDLMGVQLYASAIDQLPRNVCASSDEGHFIYVSIPAGATEEQVAAVVANPSGDLMHQAAHVVQWGRRLAGGGTLLPSWVAEGQAEAVTEYVGLRLSGPYDTQQNLGPDILDSNLGLNPAFQPWITDRFDRLAYFNGWNGNLGKVAGAPEGCSLFGFGSIAQVCLPGAVPGAAWSFMRYVADRYAPTWPGSEPAFHRAVADIEPTGDFITELEALLGASVPELIVDWAGTLYADERLTPAQAPLLQMTTWQLPDMLLHPTYSGRQLVPSLHGFTDFARTGAFVGGGTAYARLDSGGAHGPVAIEVDDGAEGPIHEAMGARLWVLRMR